MFIPVGMAATDAMAETGEMGGMVETHVVLGTNTRADPLDPVDTMGLLGLLDHKEKWVPPDHKEKWDPLRKIICHPVISTQFIHE